MMPIEMVSGRIYIADGELDIGALQNGALVNVQHPAFKDPNQANFNISFGFMEANQAGVKIYANPSYVDFVGLHLKMETVAEDKSANISGLPSNGIERMCELLQAEQDKDGYPWRTELCVGEPGGDPIRILSPQHRLEKFAGYFEPYIDEVWQFLSSNGI